MILPVQNSHKWNNILSKYTLILRNVNFKSITAKNIFDIFDSMIITHNTELLSSGRKKSDDSNIVNNVLMKYLFEKKERTNLN